MEVTQDVSQQDRLQLITEKRKWQAEIENKKRQLEDDRRSLQHMKSKSLRERWLLDGAAGTHQDQVQSQVDQDQDKTRSLEETITRLEQELLILESEAVCQTIKHTTVSSGSVQDVEVKGHRSLQQDRAPPSAQEVHALAEIKVPKSSAIKTREEQEEMKRAMYSVEIRVERDRQTGETRILSTNTTLPVDLSLQGVKVYEDERKVVHEMNGDDGFHLLSSSEVDELIHKADEASMMSETVATVTSLPTAEFQEEAEPIPPRSDPPLTEITGLETKAHTEPSVDEASAENPLTMVFMGYQSVEDEAQTKKVLGLQGTVTAERVLIDDPKTSPPRRKRDKTDRRAQKEAPPPTASTQPPPASTRPPPASDVPPTAIMANNGETAGQEQKEVQGEEQGGAVQIKKEKQPCKCCSIM